MLLVDYVSNNGCLGSGTSLTILYRGAVPCSTSQWKALLVRVQSIWQPGTGAKVSLLMLGVLERKIKHDIRVSKHCIQNSSPNTSRFSYAVYTRGSSCLMSHKLLGYTFQSLDFCVQLYQLKTASLLCFPRILLSLVVLTLTYYMSFLKAGGRISTICKV